MSELRFPAGGDRLEFLGLPLDAVTSEQAVAAVDEFISGWDGGPPKIGFTLNAQGVHVALGDPEFARLIHKADLVRADGMALLLGTKILGESVPERLCTTDFIRPVASLCVEKSYSIYFLGATQEVVEAAAEAFANDFPGLNIAGTHHGYLQDPELNERIINEVNEKAPSILLVGMGRPLQERWVMGNRDKLRVPFCMTCGGLFKFISGTERRAPAWMHRVGLEWLHRLAFDPRRMWKRYLVGNTVFMYHVCKARLTRKRPK